MSLSTSATLPSALPIASSILSSSSSSLPSVRTTIGEATRQLALQCLIDITDSIDVQLTDKQIVTQVQRDLDNSHAEHLTSGNVRSIYAQLVKTAKKIEDRLECKMKQYIERKQKYDSERKTLEEKHKKAKSRKGKSDSEKALGELICPMTPSLDESDQLKIECLKRWRKAVDYGVQKQAEEKAAVKAAEQEAKMRAKEAKEQAKIRAKEDRAREKEIERERKNRRRNGLGSGDENEDPNIQVRFRSRKKLYHQVGNGLRQNRDQTDEAAKVHLELEKYMLEYFKQHIRMGSTSSSTTASSSCCSSSSSSSSSLVCSPRGNRGSSSLISCSNHTNPEPAGEQTSSFNYSSSLVDEDYVPGSPDTEEIDEILSPEIP